MLETRVLTTATFTYDAALTRQRRFWGLAFIGSLLLVLAVLWSLASGPIYIPISQVFYLLWHQSDTSVANLVFHSSRLPRTLIAVFAGAAFSVAGVIMQGATRNPLACPSLLGINQGAALAMIIMLLLFPNIPTGLFVPVAFLGGLVTAVLIYGITMMTGTSTLRLALAGIIINELFHALSRGLLILYPTSAQSVLFNIMGSIAGRTWQEVQLVWPWVFAGLLLSCVIWRPLTIFSLGQERAAGLGVSVRTLQGLFMAIAVVLASAAVSVVGPIPFIGLMVPSAMRYWVGNHYKYLIILSMLYGALLLVCADTLIRTVNPVVEIPVGILVALIGGPFFVLVARAQSKKAVVC